MYVELPGLSFETGFNFKTTILTTPFRKKRKYWCLDFTDCTTLNLKHWLENQCTCQDGYGSPQKEYFFKETSFTKNIRKHRF